MILRVETVCMRTSMSNSVCSRIGLRHPHVAIYSGKVSLNDVADPPPTSLPPPPWYISMPEPHIFLHVYSLRTTRKEQRFGDSNINFQKYNHMQKADNRSTNYSQAFTDSGAHNQVRSATTKKPRPQSGKPSQTEKHG